MSDKNTAPKAEARNVGAEPLKQAYLTWCEANQIDEWTCFPWIAFQAGAAHTTQALREAGQESLVVIAALLLGNTRQFSPEVLAALENANKLLLAALAAYQEKKA